MSELFSMGGDIHFASLAYACGCQGCSSSTAGALVSDGEAAVAEGFAVGGGKWGASGAPGTGGGVVTWSLAGGGLTGSLFTGNSLAFSSVFNFDYQAVIRQAFAAWSAVANIDFVQVADAGGAMGSTTFANIRLFAGAIDGKGNTLGLAYLPTGSGGTAGQSANAGDLVLDSAEGTFWTAHTLLLVAIHEIGHALGLDHEQINVAIMNAVLNTSLTGLQQDDINGIRSIYGPQDSIAPVYTMSASQTSLALLDAPGGLTVNGNALGNTISGTAQGETISGLGGNDTINGGAGSDRLNGDSAASAGSGISLGSGQLVKTATMGNNSIATALDISDHFSFAADAQIENATTIPHVSVVATGNGAIDYYVVTIHHPGARLIIDLDYGDGDGGAAGFDSMIRILDASGNTLAENDDRNSGDPGSVAATDSYIAFTAPTAGTYIIAVGAYPQMSVVGSGGTYELQVSVEGELTEQGGADVLNGDDGADTLMGGTGNDTLSGGVGNDNLWGGTGADVLDGGEGTDYVRYDVVSSTQPVTISLQTPTQNTGDAAGDTFTSIEGVIGSYGSDSITGNNQANNLRGGNGNDTVDGGTGNDTLLGNNGYDVLRGDGGNDVLSGNAGRDTLTGGAGLDVFLFDAALSAATNVDVITDFNVANDTIRLENAIFTALTQTGVLAAGAFHIGTAAADADDRIIYQASSGYLLYDADGTGAGAAVRFALLSTGLALTSADFVIV